MKKKIAIIILVLISIIGLIYRQHLNKEKDNNKEMIAIFLETEKGTGKYQRSSLKNWSFGDEYVINIQKSYCKNGGLLRWNQETKKISAKIKGSDECYVYFDKDEYGTKEHPYLIQTIEDLVRLSNSVNIDNVNYSGKYFLLTNDLDFQDKSDYEDANRTDFGDINGQNGNEALITELTTGSGFIPIGKDINSNYFQGTFDGGNKRIDNLYIVNTSNVRKNIGLFGNTNINTTIKNLTVSGSMIRTTNGEMGGLIARADGTLNIENCHNEVTLNSSSEINTAAGLLGSLGGGSSATIKNSSNRGQINGGENAAGLVAYVGGALTVENSVNYGEISNNVGPYAGGIIGRDNAADREKTIINSHNEGIIKSKNYAGGLIGSTLGNVTIKKCYNASKAETLGIYAGGLIGYSSNSINIQNSYNLATIKGLDDNVTWVGGLIATMGGTQIVTSKITNSYNTGNITGSFRTGGIVSLIWDAEVIMDKCFNTGDIVNLGSGTSYAGGLTSAAGLNKLTDGNLIILNSYNTGNITNQSEVENGNETASGLIGASFTNSNYQVLVFNSYNTGNIIADNFANGIIKNFQELLFLKNTFNIGNVKAEVNYGIGQIGNNITNVANNYYLDNVSNGSNIANVGSKMKMESMKQQTFVDELNKNIANINLEEINELLKGYTLSKWQLGSNGYPELINN